MTQITATDAGRDLIARLSRDHGALSLHVSGSYGVSVVCLSRSELTLGARDVLMGHLDGVPVYFMTSEADYWRGSTVILDVARGVAAGFSLEGPLGVHFTLRKRADPTKRVWNADTILAAGPPPSHDTRNSLDD
jgi:uncharacterized protein